MKSYQLPSQFDGEKFATRYGLNSLNGDFWFDGVNLIVPDDLPDDPPIFDAPDTPTVVLQRVSLGLVDQALPQSQVLRAALLTIFDEMNLHALKINAILDAVDAATSLADLKTRIGNVTDYPARTKVQAINAIKAKISSGEVD